MMVGIKRRLHKGADVEPMSLLAQGGRAVRRPVMEAIEG
jgi:hypothetical protein